MSAPAWIDGHRSAEDVHCFWFPEALNDMDHDAVADLATWWMQGGASAELPPFRPVVEAAEAGPN